MRRACWVTVLLLAALAPAPGVRAAVKGVDVINGIGLIDYSHRPDFEVGWYAKYRVTGHSEMGESDDYQVTVLIAAEERFWGEDCFWVETVLEPRGRPARRVASLMSYDIFTDSLPIPRMQYYMRKTIEGISAEGAPVEAVMRRPASTLKKRTPVLSEVDWRVDTLGVDSVLTPAGAFVCRQIRYNEGKAASVDQRDSTVRTEVRETRVAYYSSDVPVTGLARERIENLIQRRTWAIGRSAEVSKLNTMDRAVGEARLIEVGRGMKSQMLPEGRQKSLKQWDAEIAATRARAKPGGAPTRRN